MGTMKGKAGDLFAFVIFLVPAVVNWEEVLKRLASIFH